MVPTFCKYLQIGFQNLQIISQASIKKTNLKLGFKMVSNYFQNIGEGLKSIGEYWGRAA